VRRESRRQVLVLHAGRSAGSWPLPFRKAARSAAQGVPGRSTSYGILGPGPWMLHDQAQEGVTA